MKFYEWKLMRHFKVLMKSNLTMQVEKTYTWRQCQHFVSVETQIPGFLSCLPDCDSGLMSVVESFLFVAMPTPHSKVPAISAKPFMALNILGPSFNLRHQASPVSCVNVCRYWRTTIWIFYFDVWFKTESISLSKRHWVQFINQIL